MYTYLSLYIYLYISLSLSLSIYIYIGLCAADRAGRDAAAASAAAAAVCCSMIIYIYIYIYIILLVRNLLISWGNINCSNKFNHLLRKYVFFIRNMVIQRKISICFENIEYYVKHITIWSKILVSDNHRRDGPQ